MTRTNIKDLPLNLKNLLNFLKKHGKKKVSLDTAIKDYIRPGSRIFIGSGCSEPIDFTKKLIEFAPKLPDVEIIHLLSLSDLNYYAATEGMENLFRYNAFFIGKSLRNFVLEGRADYTPMLLSDIPRLFKTGQVHLDTALLQVSPPDKKGYCSLGINVDISKAVAESAEKVVVEINPKMPRTYGDSLIHMDNIDAFVLTDHDIIEFTYDPPDENSKKIARFVASLVEDGSTIQIGIGKVSNAVVSALSEKKDIGVHSVVITDDIVDLVEKGVITCKKKTINKGKIACAFALGTNKLYNFVNNNPFVEFYPCDYVNDPIIISKNRKQISINGAISVDLTGQVNVDSLGYRFYSGLGGLVDFMTGAAKSEDGKPIIVLPSTVTLPNGNVISRIMPCLQPCSGVAIPRSNVHYIITEWGIAYLYGKSIRERVLQMINIAHPDFREELLEHAKNCNYVYLDQELPKSIDGRISVYPYRYESKVQLKNGKTLIIRPVKPSDERMIQELYYSLDKDELYYRFFSSVKDFRHTKILPMVNIDYSTNMILVVINAEGEKKDVIASGGFFKTEDPSQVEMAWVTNKDWRGQGIARILLKNLVKIARELKYRSIKAQVIYDNAPMMHILNTSSYDLISKKTEAGIVKFVIDIQKRIKFDINEYGLIL